MTQSALALQRAFSNLLELARGDAYGSQPQLYSLTWLAAARMVTAGTVPLEGLASLSESSNWKELLEAGLPAEAVERIGVLRPQDGGRRAHAVTVVTDLYRALGTSQWNVLPLLVDASLKRPYDIELAVLPALAPLLLDLVGPPAEDKELWIPFEGMGQLTIEALRRGWTVRTASPLGASQLRLDLLLLIETGRVEHPRVLRDVQHTDLLTPAGKATHVLAVPPFGMPIRQSRLADWDTTGAVEQFGRSESWTVHEFLSRATERAVFVVPPGLLFSRQEERLREDILHRGGERNELEAVIALPAGILAAAPALGGAALVMTPGQGHDTVRMVDLGSGRRAVSEASDILTREHEHNVAGTQSAANIALVGRDEIAENEYSLMPSRYLRRVSDLGESKKLADLVEAIRPPSPAKAETSYIAYEVGVSDLNNWRPLESRGDRSVHLRGEPKPGTLLRPGDLVVSIKGTVGKVAVIGNIADSEQLVPSQSCLALRVPDQLRSSTFSPEYLLMYLRSEHGRAQLQGLEVGTGVRHISPNTFLATAVPVLEPEEYESVREDFKELCQLEEQQAQLESRMLEIRHRRWTQDTP